MPQITLSVQEIIYAAILAFFFTWLILNISKAFKLVVGNPSEYDYPQGEASKILQKCYYLFPREVVHFHGQVFRRGMTVRVVTNQKKTFEGELIGLNSENMLCVLTKRYIVAHELDAIEEMSELDPALQ